MKSDRVIIAILQPLVRDSALAENLRVKTAALVKSVLGTAEIREVFIEGGATAEVVLDALEYRTFDVTGEYGPGVAQMRVAPRSCFRKKTRGRVGRQNQYVTIKPGSYPWPKGIWI